MSWWFLGNSYQFDDDNIFSDKSASDTKTGEIAFLYNPGNIHIPLQRSNQDAKESVLIEKIKKRYPEFEFSSMETGRGKRKGYLGDRDICCAYPMSYYYTDSKTGEIFYTKEKFSNILDIVFISCHPDTKNFTTSRYCAPLYYEICIDKKEKKDLEQRPLNKYIEPSCGTWIQSIFKFATLSPYYSYILKKVMSDICNQSKLSKECIKYLNILTNLKNAYYGNIKKDIFNQQNKQIKDDYLRCSYPSIDILVKAKSIIEPRQCWDSNCIFAEDWQLLDDDLVVKQTKCKLAECHVNFDYINIEDSNIKISCRNHFDNKGNSIISYKKALDSFINIYQIPAFGQYIILILTIVFIYSFCHFINKMKLKEKMPLKRP